MGSQVLCAQSCRHFRKKMLCLYFFILATPLLVRALSDDRRWSNLAGRKEFSLNMQEIRNLEVKDEYVHDDPFEHTKEFMSALRQGKKSFSVVVSVSDHATAQMKFDDIVHLKDYNITTNYFLHADAEYHSLDEAHTLNAMKEVTNNHLVHCGGKKIKIGDFIVGTAHAPWRARPFAVKSKHQNGLVLIRQAIAQETYHDEGSDSAQACTKTSTTELHPFELFDHFRVQTVAHIPFIYDDFDLSDKTTYQEPVAFSEDYAAVHGGISTEALPVDSPAQSCQSVKDQYFNDYFSTNGDFQDRANDDFSMIVGNEVGCASANMKFPCCSAFTFNYNQNTRTATKALDLSQAGITGLSCTNCFAYTGAYIMAVVDYYDYGHHMALEVKVSGGLGFNVAASMTNPAFSGSVTKTLLAASPNNVFYLPLGASGMTLSTSFGGLEGVLSGSGSATGTASFNVGASANAYLGIGYHDLTTGAGWTLPSGVSFSYVPPSAYYSTFQVNRININVELVATQQFSVGYTWLYIKYIAADFTVALTGSANYAYTSSSSVAPSVAVSVVSVSPSDDDSLKVITSSPDADAADAPLELSPGDSLALSVEYENFNPGERTELFVSVHRDDDLSETGISVLQVPFTVNGAGRGSVEVRWVVPWDTKFMQRVGQAVRTDGGALLARLSVHASNQMSVRFFAPQALKLTADPHMYGMMKLPQPDEIIAVNTTYVVVWNSEGLRTFKRSVAGTSGIGSMQTVPFVNIELLYEDVNPSSGETALAGHFRLNASPEPNDRSAPVTFPRAALADVTAGCVRRFFVVVSSTVSANLMGWSEGYFHLVDSLEESPDAAVLPRIQPAGAANAQRRDGLHKADPLFHRPRGAALLGHEQAVRALPHSAPSPLSSCSSGTSVTYGSTVEGAFVSITCFTFVWPLEGYEHGFTLLNSQSCVSQPYAVEGADPVPTPSSDSSASNDQELSTAWVAGISAMATCLALAVAAVLYMRCYNAVTAHKEVDEAGQIDLPCPDATKATQAQELATEAAIANPLSTATEV